MSYVYTAKYKLIKLQGYDESRQFVGIPVCCIACIDNKKLISHVTLHYFCTLPAALGRAVSLLPEEPPRQQLWKRPLCLVHSSSAVCQGLWPVPLWGLQRWGVSGDLGPWGFRQGFVGNRDMHNKSVHECVMKLAMGTAREWMGHELGVWSSENGVILVDMDVYRALLRWKCILWVIAEHSLAVILTVNQY